MENDLTRTVHVDKWMRLFVFKMTQLKGLSHLKTFLAALMVKGIKLQNTYNPWWEILTWQIWIRDRNYDSSSYPTCPEQFLSQCRFLNKYLFQKMDDFMEGRETLPLFAHVG